MSGLLRVRRRPPRRRRHAARAAGLQGAAARRRDVRAARRSTSRCTSRSSAASRWCATASSNEILPRMADMGIYTQVVTSAVRPIPIEWAGLRRLQIVVSIDGLQPEHDERRKPATYERILKHIEGHDIRVHCTVTRQQVRRDGYLEEFAKFWSANPAVSQIWISLYTPQVGEISDGAPDARPTARRWSPTCSRFAAKYPKLRDAEALLDAYVAAARTRRTTASSRRRRPACRRISRSRSRRASSAATPTARTAAALHLRRSRPSAVTSCRAAFASASCSTRRSRSGIV